MSKRTLLACCCCILYSFDNRGRRLECESRRESHESENWKWVFFEYTDGILRHKVNSLLPVIMLTIRIGCETNQLFFSVSASYSSFTWGTKLLP